MGLWSLPETTMTMLRRRESCLMAVWGPRQAPTLAVLLDITFTDTRARKLWLGLLCLRGFDNACGSLKLTPHYTALGQSFDAERQ